jgi:hypothetical protein
MNVGIICPWCGEDVPYSEYRNHMESKHPELVGKELSRTTVDQQPLAHGVNVRDLYEKAGYHIPKVPPILAAGKQEEKKRKK